MNGSYRAIPLKEWGEVRETLGGPFLLVSRRSFQKWRVHAVASDQESDYRRAGAIDGWTGLVTVGTELAIVLWGEPLPLRSWRESNESLCLCRTYACEGDYFRERPAKPMTPPVETLQVEMTAGEYYLTDAVASPGNMDWKEGVRLHPGRYEVSTWDERPENQGDCHVITWIKRIAPDG